MLCRQPGKSAATDKSPVWIRATMPQNVFGYDSLFPNASAILRYGRKHRKHSLPTSQPHEPGSVYRLEPDVEGGGWVGGADGGTGGHVFNVRF